jgi:hypothetical protein
MVDKLNITFLRLDIKITPEHKIETCLPQRKLLVT